MLFKLLILIFLATPLVCAIPIQDKQALHVVLPRGGNVKYAQLDDNSKKTAIKFVNDMNPQLLENLGDTPKTIFSKDSNGIQWERKKPQRTGYRLDNQGQTTGGGINLQVQINGLTGDKSTVGGIITDGTLSGNQVKHHLIQTIRHPPKDENGKDIMLTVGKQSGAAPAKVSNEQARKRKTPRKPKPTNPNSRRLRKQGRGQFSQVSPELEEKHARKIKANGELAKEKARKLRGDQQRATPEEESKTGGKLKGKEF